MCDDRLCFFILINNVQIPNRDNAQWRKELHSYGSASNLLRKVMVFPGSLSFHSTPKCDRFGKNNFAVALCLLSVSCCYCCCTTHDNDNARRQAHCKSLFKSGRCPLDVFCRRRKSCARSHSWVIQVFYSLMPCNGV